jgi:hypothetical protein
MTTPSKPNPDPQPKPKLARLPLVLLGLMTLFSFGGPLAIGWVLGGGSSPDWPPDRPVEWATLLGISAMVAILMAACVALGLANRQAMVRRPDPVEPEASRVDP